jgi:hypothetical protein
LQTYNPTILATSESINDIYIYIYIYIVTCCIAEYILNKTAA